ncbi:Hypothetical predicted protein [Mytilus galloprovincialis]|uniref:Uncharacterized protein n=1 Tax=Mytilus galloprovincialis TaxID=29158 RepID=A0A8B6GS45_MYTGA|nr:Hypothetical predicted protein [Mytilus galloprovincialis]
MDWTLQDDEVGCEGKIRDPQKRSFKRGLEFQNYLKIQVRLTKQEVNNLSGREKRQCPQNRQTENEKRNSTHKERRNIFTVEDQENARRNETRSQKPDMHTVRAQGNAKRQRKTRPDRKRILEVRD